MPAPSRPAKSADASPFEKRKRKPICPKMILNAPEGFGKTTYLSHAPGAAIIMVGNETGYDTLLSSGSVPSIPAMLVNEWKALLEAIDYLIANPGDIKTLGIDAISGAERLCHAHVCKTKFKGDWGDAGFMSYNKGYDVSISEWEKLLARLERLNQKHGVVIVLLGHTKIKTFNNPMGASFDRYICDCHEKTWAPAAKWADAVFFGQFLTVVDEEQKVGKGKKGKGIGGIDRVIYTQRRDAFDAKNRYQMIPEIWLDEVEPEGMFDAVWSQIVKDDTDD